MPEARNHQRPHRLSSSESGVGGGHHHHHHEYPNQTLFEHIKEKQ
ncbi:unnamed protein product, partial [Rotaria magnacalcarata]